MSWKSVYLTTKTGGTWILTGPTAEQVADFLVEAFGDRRCTREEWEKARSKPRDPE